MAERGHLLDKCSLLYFFQKISRVHHRSREGQPKPGLNKKRMLNIVKQQWYTGWSEVTNYPSWLTHLLVIAGKYFPETTTNQTIQKPIICVCVSLGFNQQQTKPCVIFFRRATFRWSTFRESFNAGIESSWNIQHNTFQVQLGCNQKIGPLMYLPT